jgi:hypothetical protein
MHQIGGSDCHNARANEAATLIEDMHREPFLSSVKFATIKLTRYLKFTAVEILFSPARRDLFQLQAQERSKMKIFWASTNPHKVGYRKNRLTDKLQSIKGSSEGKRSRHNHTQEQPPCLL